MAKSTGARVRVIVKESAELPGYVEHEVRARGDHSGGVPADEADTRRITPPTRAARGAFFLYCLELLI